uniref:Uncharacterized protein n=1 Tax=Anguilla anguilla TaxID=7936 RepID=A0A0E9PMS9_ANGAN
MSFIQITFLTSPQTLFHKHDLITLLHCTFVYLNVIGLYNYYVFAAYI